MWEVCDFLKMLGPWAGRGGHPWPDVEPQAAVCKLREEIKLEEVEMTYFSQSFLISSPSKYLSKCNVPKGAQGGVKDQKARPPHL